MEALMYLKPEQYYIDRFDLFTIEKCLDIIDVYKKTYEKSLITEELKNISEQEKIKSVNQLLLWRLFYLKAKEYEKKAETINKWMEEDRKKQEIFDNTPEPRGIYCLECGAKMFNTLKTLEDFLDRPLRMLFFFECSSCKKRRLIYENGEERKRTPEQCEKCKKEVVSTHTKEGQVITTTTRCAHCGHLETDIDDFEKSHADWEKRKLEEQKLLAKYRTEFCLSAEEGKNNSELLEAVEVADIVYKEELQKFNVPAYESISRLKKIGIVELEKMLGERLGNDQYIKLSFEKPEINQYVVVPFSVQDANTSRQSQKSIIQIESIIKETLAVTNWRLIDNDVSCRLGYIFGKLKGYERDEDLLEICGKQKEKKQSKVDPKMMMKYEYHAYVQIAKLMAELEGKENIRKRRLEKEPEGFYLGANEGPYSCGVCKRTMDGNNLWWTIDGLTCTDCRRNIIEKVIPNLLKMKKESWIKDWEMKSEYSVHPSTRGKLEREGLLKGKHLKLPNGQTYFSVYLVEDNEEFFRKYPKKPEMDVRLEWGKDGKIILYVKKIEYPKDTAKEIEKVKKSAKN